MYKGKVKCTLVQALRLCTGRTAHRGSRGITLLFLDHGTRRGEGSASRPPPALYPRERPGTHCIGGWVGPRVGLDRCGKYRPTEIRSPDRPAPSQSLYRLSYPRKMYSNIKILNLRSSLQARDQAHAHTKLEWYIYIYIYIYTHTHTHTHNFLSSRGQKTILKPMMAIISWIQYWIITVLGIA